MCSSRSPHPSPLHHHQCCPALWWEQTGAHHLTAAALSEWHLSRNYRPVCLWKKGLHAQKCKPPLHRSHTHREGCSLKAGLNSGTLLRYLWLLRFAAFFKKISKLTMNPHCQYVQTWWEAPEAAVLRAWATPQNSAVRKEIWTHALNLCTKNQHLPLQGKSWPQWFQLFC